MKKISYSFLLPFIFIANVLGGCATAPKNVLPKHVKVAQDSSLCIAVKREADNFAKFLQEEANPHKLKTGVSVLECREFEEPGLGYGLITIWFLTDTNKLHTEIDGIMYFVKDNDKWNFVQIKPVASWEHVKSLADDSENNIHTL